MCSWKETDFIAALSTPEFLSKLHEVNNDVPEDRTAALGWLEKQFHFGGGSARWVFGLKIDEIQHIILVVMKNQNQIDDVVSGVMGETTAEIHNSLRAVYWDTETSKHFYIFASRFIMRLAVMKCSARVIRSMTLFSKCVDNPSFDGWVFEYTFLHAVKSALHSSGGPGWIQVTQYGTYDTNESEDEENEDEEGEGEEKQQKMGCQIHKII